MGRDRSEYSVLTDRELAYREVRDRAYSSSVASAAGVSSLAQATCDATMRRCIRWACAVCCVEAIVIDWVCLHLCEQLTFEQIATGADVSVSTVQADVSVALGALRTSARAWNILMIYPVVAEACSVSEGYVDACSVSAARERRKEEAPVG